MWSVYKRLAELTDKKVLTADEELEMAVCLKANLQIARELSNLENLSYMAFTTEDWEWLGEVSAKIDDVYNKMIGMPSGYHHKKPKRNRNKKKKEE